MKKFVFIILTLALTVYLTACGKKQQSLEEMQEPMSIEELSALNTSLPPESAVNASAVQPEAAPEAALKPLPPLVTKPTNQEIQTALKNAGFYTGEIDGKIGPLSKQAIKDFQAKNALEADGKVGLKTWTVLSVYLNPQPAAQTKAKKNKR